jgi:hypothetical protein
METQQVLAPNDPMFWLPDQSSIGFPLSLAEKYQPRKPQQFIGLTRAKSLVSNLSLRPRPCATLFVGPPGAGKSAMAMAFAECLPGSLHHVGAQKCDVAALDALNEKFAYTPPVGKYWVCLVDEADQMTEKAQLQLLSRLDGTAALRPMFGGGFERGEAPPVIWIFTTNGTGPGGIVPPTSLLPRFLSRCMVTEFPAATVEDLSLYLRHIWESEGGCETPLGYFDYIAEGVGVRDALQRIDSDLLCGCRPRPVAPVPAARPCHTLNDSPQRRAWQTRT